MNAPQFKALLLKSEEGRVFPEIVRLTPDELPAGDVLVEVAYSSLNYKDAMALGNKGIIRKFPCVPGIDFSGVVRASDDPRYQPGDAVILTGWGVGERHWGGFAQLARVKGDWLVPLPAGLSLKQAMQIGTAGLTAMLCVEAIEHQGIRPESGEILVTGASGGVGSVAVALLAALGYKVCAMTRPGQEDYLRQLGAARTIDRAALAEGARPGRQAMETETFAGAIDTVGGATLAAIVARLSYRGAVAACGLVGGTDVDTSVFPFILRGVSLIGIDSVRCPAALRLAAWQRLAQHFPFARGAAIGRDIALEEVPAAAAELLAGQGHGRIVVDLHG